MRFTAAVSFLTFSWNAALGQVNPPAVARPSALEALAGQPEARVVWSKEAGRLESGETRAVVTALIVEDSQQRARRARGARIDFSEPGWKGHVYIDESLLEPLKKIYDQLAVDIGRVSYRSGTSPGFVGSCEFRNNPGVYPLQADYQYSGGGSPALVLRAPYRIVFPGLLPSHLANVLGSAIEELKAH